MNLQEIFDQLTSGELSQLAIGGAEQGAITEANYHKIIPHINLGLTALYKRFPLKESRVSFPLVPGGYSYSLKVDDLHKILQVFTDAGVELGLNNEADIYSCFTPSLKVLRVDKDVVDQVSTLPDSLKTVALEVVYRANHPKVVQRQGYFDPSRVTLELPDSHLEPLLYFIAARIQAPYGQGQFEGFASNNFMTKYEAACMRLTNQGPTHENNSGTDKLRGRGFV